MTVSKIFRKNLIHVTFHPLNIFFEEMASSQVLQKNL